MATLNRLTHLETSLENLPCGREFKYSPSLIASASECELPTLESVLGSLAAVSSFFGYLGFDAMACVAGEAINAERNLPLSIMITLVIVTTLYVAAAIALVGMQSYQDISPESGFPGPLSV
jgi:amino acid transporter